MLLLKTVLSGLPGRTFSFSVTLRLFTCHAEYVKIYLEKYCEVGYG